MSERDYFRDALSDFTYEAASGGAIRHLADLGYTARQISERLTYPTPYERVRRTLWQHLNDSGIVLTQEPGGGARRAKPTYRVERDRFGRAGFRRETEGAEETEKICWHESRYSRERCGDLAAYLAKMCGGCGEEGAYLSCDFGLRALREDGTLAAALGVLNGRQREYIEGLMWEDRICYHRLDSRMREILTRLYAGGYYHGYCYFLKQREKVAVG